jgi:long-chain acyl-CoA synthetase
MWTAWVNLADASPDSFAGVRRSRSGASALPRSTYDLMNERFGITVGEGYGLTETSPVVSTVVENDIRAGSIGRPLPGIALRLVDSDGQDALVGDAGEIWVRGPNVFAGYWGDDEATTRVLTDDGWLMTGDIAIADDDGHLALVDRAKDIIIVLGFNVYPAEVEEVLLTHRAVRQAVVVGRPHPTSGESVVAHVVLTDGVAAEEDDIIEHCAELLARYKCPSKVFMAKELPIAPSGKLIRRLVG